MIELVKEILDGTLLLSLNPVTWIIVIFPSVWTKQYWIPAIAGVLSQVASVSLLTIFFILFERISVDDLFTEVSVEDIVLLLSVCVLSGMIISALVTLLVRERRLKRDTSIW